MVKRSLSSSPAGEQNDISSPATPVDPISDATSDSKKAKVSTPKFKPKSKKTPTPKDKSSAKDDKDPLTPITPEIKAFMLEGALELAYKSLAFDEYSASTGISASRLKDQFKANRSNLRKAAVEGLKAGGQK